MNPLRILSVIGQSEFLQQSEFQKGEGILNNSKPNKAEDEQKELLGEKMDIKVIINIQK